MSRQSSDTTADRAEVRFVRTDPTTAAAQTAMAAYFAEIDRRFDTGFDASSANAEDPGNLSGPSGAFVLVISDADPIGCGGVQRVDDTTGEIKRMWIHERWRGRGLGHLLLAHLESVATELGYAVVVLDTNAVLVEAIAMYESAGYRPTERYNDNPYASRWFTKTL